MHWTIGIDEAGRGPLAGPVAVGVFAVPEGLDLELLAGIRDSKKLSERQREVWCVRLGALTDVRHAVSLVGAGHIDQYGIVHAVQTAMAHALTKLDLDPGVCTVLLDGGLRAPAVYTNQTTIIRGDASEQVISAAAILAKVTRDRHMVRQAEKYPEYGFTQHKGYGTVAHRAAIRQYGPSELHRKTFCH